MLISNARLVTWGTPNQILENHALHFEGGRIREIGPQGVSRRFWAPKN